MARGITYRRYDGTPFKVVDDRRAFLMSGENLIEVEDADICAKIILMSAIISEESAREMAEGSSVTP